MRDLRCECGITFENKGALKSHQNFCDESDRQAPDISYNKVECPECGDLVAETQLENHKNSKTCKAGGTFETIGSYDKDVKFKVKKEWKIEDGDYQCPECDEVHSKKGMVNHYYRKHTEEGRKLCKGLGKHREGIIEKMNKAKREKGFLNAYEKAKILEDPLPELPTGGFESHTEESKEKISKTISEKFKNNEWGKGSSHTLERKSGETIRLDSEWEVIFCEQLLEYNINFQREPETFEYFDGKGNKRRYIPDFKIEDKFFVEIKGWKKDEDSYKWNQFPFDLFVIMKHGMKKLDKVNNFQNIKEIADKKFI